MVKRELMKQSVGATITQLSGILQMVSSFLQVLTGLHGSWGKRQ